MSSICDISVVIPVYNEESNLAELLERNLTTMRTLNRSFELILVDDGSRDKSATMITTAAKEHAEVIGIILNRNYGQHAAIMAGFSKAKGEFVITLDADLQNPPEEIPRIIEKMDQGFDVVGTIRMKRKDTFFRRWASSLVNKAIRRATGVMMHDYGCMLRGYHGDVVQAMLSCKEKTTFIPVLANSFARNGTEIDVHHAPREQGNSKYSVFKLLSLQFDLLTTMTIFPIRIMCFVGAIMASLGTLFGVFLLIARLWLGAAWAADGVFTLFAVLFLFLGIQLFATGLIGEYIGRIFIQIQGRPSFFIHQVISGPSSGKKTCEETLESKKQHSPS